MKWDKNYIRRTFRYYANIYDHIDTDDAAQRIKSAIWFRGPNVWILAFSIIIASVGLNVNSTAVIIGAMLISPLMGPIIGTGLAIGTNDVDLLKVAFKNLVVMVLISLAASTLFFLISPLDLINPTELEARTSPTIYDVLIAFFGGLAGILENSRKERGTTIAGVAIATALMPPLCTAGYGLSCLNMHFFLGAMYLFIINGVFITLATYIMVKYLRFKTVTGIAPALALQRSRLMSAIIAVVVIPSLISAAVMVKDNNFERNVESFVRENRLVSRSYIYDYRIFKDHGRKVEIFLTGEPMSFEAQTAFYASAREHRIKDSQLVVKEHSLGMTGEEMNAMVREIYDRTDQELAEKEARLDLLQARLDSLTRKVEALSAPEEEKEEPAI
jgi:Predicted membrane protein